MATIRAVMKAHDFFPVDADTFTYFARWACWPLDGSGELFDVETSTPVETGDGASAVQGKIIDSIVAAILRRQPTDSLPRTNVYLLQLNRGA